MKTDTQRAHDQSVFKTALLKKVKDAPRDFDFAGERSLVSLIVAEDFFHMALKLERDKKIPHVRAKNRTSKKAQIKIQESIGPKAPTKKKDVTPKAKGKPVRNKKCPDLGLDDEF